jgi:hypothetical protein
MAAIVTQNAEKKIFEDLGLPFPAWGINVQIQH